LGEGWEVASQVRKRDPAFPIVYMTGVAAKRAGWGRIINIGSRVGRTFAPGSGAAYSASKAGLIGFTRVLAVEGAAAFLVTDDADYITGASIDINGGAFMG
jgi:NAD(P)-dependent dehydrogenase (short-subunit alcohol dehydrogenase family)